MRMNFWVPALLCVSRTCGRDDNENKTAMPRVTFGSALQRHVSVPPQEVAGASVREALDSVFQAFPLTRSYVLDDQSALRKHMSIFIDGVAIKDRKTLSDAVQPQSHVYVVQALSGG